MLFIPIIHSYLPLPGWNTLLSTAFSPGRARFEPRTHAVLNTRQWMSEWEFDSSGRLPQIRMAIQGATHTTILHGFYPLKTECGCLHGGIIYRKRSRTQPSWRGLYLSCTSPWYNRHGWLGITNQLSIYLSCTFMWVHILGDPKDIQVRNVTTTTWTT